MLLECPSEKDFPLRVEACAKKGTGATDPAAKKRRHALQKRSAEDAKTIVAEQDQGRKVERVACATGNTMIDQFEPWYFGIAFAFLFKYCTGMPDPPAFAKKPRYRRQADAPRIETPLWVRCMSRRIEAQLARDWTFGFATWNYMFRSVVNLSRTIYAYDHVKSEDGTSESLTPEMLEKGSC